MTAQQGVEVVDFNQNAGCSAQVAPRHGQNPVQRRLEAFAVICIIQADLVGCGTRRTGLARDDGHERRQAKRKKQQDRLSAQPETPEDECR